MSLYGKPNADQRSLSKNFILTSYFPIWILAIAVFTAVITLTNNIPTLITWILPSDIYYDYFQSLLSKGKFATAFTLLAPSLKDNPEYIWYILGNVSGSFSVIVIAIYLITKNMMLITYLVMASLFDLTRCIILILENFDRLSPPWYTLKGIDFYPEQVISWTIGWQNLGDNIQIFVYVGASIASVAFCFLLIYISINESKLASHNT